MSDPKAGTGAPSAALRRHTRGKKDSAGELPLGDCSKCRQLREKKIKNFLQATFWAFNFLLKDASALPDSSAVGY